MKVVMQFHFIIMFSFLIPYGLIGQTNLFTNSLESSWDYNSEMFAFASNVEVEAPQYHYDSFNENSLSKLAFPPLSVCIITSNTKCNLNNGSATAVVNGIIANPTYEWSTGQTGQIIKGLGNGIISVTVTDGGNSGTASAIVGYDDPNVINWNANYGGSEQDYARDIIETKDSGFLIGGFSVSNNGILSANYGGDDFWVVKTDLAGSIIWTRNYGGSADDQLINLLEVNDGYILAGHTNSNDINVPQNKGIWDFLVIKIDFNGNVIWSRIYGGNNSEFLYDIKQANDGGFFLAGATFSTLLVPPAKGGADYYIVKIDAFGNVIEQATYGGTLNDQATAIEELDDGRVIVAGFSESNDGDVIGNNSLGTSDYWVLLLDPTLKSPVWSRNYGGTSSDQPWDLQITKDGNFYIAGVSRSNDGDLPGNYGERDYWLLEIDINGNIQNSKNYGGSSNEVAYSLMPTGDGGYLVGGYSFSNDGDINSGNQGSGDFWLLQLDDVLGIRWEETFGGINSEVSRKAIQTTAGNYIALGYSDSSPTGDVTQSYGKGDYWVVHLGQKEKGTVTLNGINPTCGLPNGSISSKVVNVANPVTYLWSTGQTTANLTNVQDGYFTLTVTDVVGCESTASFTLNSQGNITACIITKMTTCSLSNGSATVIATGGSGAYSYVWSTGQNSQVITDLPNGLVTVTVTDISGLCSTVVSGFVNFAEEPVIEWENTYGGTSYDVGTDIQRTLDGGYIIAANTRSNDVHVSSNNGFQDYWLLKIDPVGAIEWENTFGGTILETANTVKQTPDGGYIIGGAAQSNDGDVGNNYLAEDAWVVRTDQMGNLIWEQNYGGSLDDVCYAIHNINNNQFVFGGHTSSIDFDVASSLGAIDYWLVNINAGATLSGQETFGGSNNDFSYDMKPTTDGGYIMVGKTASNDGDVSTNAGNDDVWVVKVTKTGQLDWERSYGGTENDEGRSIQQTKDGGYIIAGSTSSFNGNISNNNGNSDLWIIKIDPSGTLTWEKTYGGSSYDYGRDVLVTNDDGFLIGGQVSSNDVFVSNNYGSYDVWVIKLNETGNLMWEKNLGGTGSDLLEAMQLTNDGGYIITGSTTSTDIDVKNPLGSNDVWVVKLNAPDVLNVIVSDESVQCFGDTDATLTATVTGGTPPYTYTWSDNSTSSDLINVGEGTYTLTVTDSNSCEATATGMVSAPSSITMIITEISPATCSTIPDGQADVIVISGGTPPFNFVWDNGVVGPANTTLSAGTHTITVTDLNGCTNTQSIDINMTNSPTIVSVDVANASCGLSNGSITINTLTGTPPYEYSLDGGTMFQSSNVFNTLGAGTYSPFVIDANLCTATFSNIGIINQSGPSLSFSTISPPCAGGNGNVNLTVTGGTSPFYYQWSNGATTEDISNVPAISYTVTVTDSNGCAETGSAMIISPLDINVTVTSVTDATCIDGDGIATANASGGAPNYSYLWDNGITQESNNSLTSGLHTVTVTDSNGCTETSSILIGQDAQVQVTLSSAFDPTCNSSNGYIYIDVANGGGVPYSFIWSNSATTQNISGLSGGTYSVTVSDVVGCTSTFSISLVDTPLLTAGISTSSNLSCFGANDGSATVLGNGGTTTTVGYTYLWSLGAEGQVTSTAINLPPGTHTVTVTDEVGCTASTSVNILSPNEITVNIIINKNAPCEGQGGSAIANSTGGSAPISVLWDDGINTPTNNQLTSGIHLVTVTDNNGCSKTASINVPTTLPPTITSIIPTDATCGASNGAIDLTVNGGAFPYAFFWDNAPDVEDPGNLAPGIYRVTITDNNGCTTTGQASINDTDGPNVSIDNIVQPTCDGNDGGIFISTLGGTAPYTYQWDNGAGTNEDISGLNAGVYNLTVTDQKGCTAFETATLNTPLQPIGTITSSSNLLCNGDNSGFISLSIAGGTIPYSFIWSNAETTQNISELAAGNYSVTFSDANNCGSVYSTTLTEPGELIASISITNSISCAGAADGGIIVSAVGGTLPYNYLWNDNQSTEEINGLPANSYSVTITDINGCIATQNIALPEPNMMVINTGIFQETQCNGGNDGSGYVEAAGGTVVGPYQYIWSNGETSSVVTDVAGFYQVTVTDDNNCFAINSITINEPDLLTVFIDNQTNSSCNINNGSADTNVDGGTPPYTYLWDNNITTSTNSTLSGGTHSITVTDNNGCVATSMIDIQFSDGPIINSISPTDPTCGASNGMIELDVAGGVTPYTFFWSNGAGTVKDPTGLSSGIYQVTVTGADGCINTGQTALNNIDGPTIVNSSHVNPTCGINNGSIDIVLSGGVLPYQFIWDNGVGNTQFPTNLVPGTYNVTVEDDAGCQVFDSFILVDPGNPAVINISIIDETCDGSNGSVSVTVSGGTPPYTYLWDNSPGTTGTITSLNAGTYNLTGTDMVGCIISATATVNAVTPISITQVTPIQPSCDLSNGSILIDAMDGSLPYQYSIDDGMNFQPGNLFSNLGPMVYNVIVRDSDGCITQTIVESLMDQPGPDINSIATTDANCGQSNGAIEVMASSSGGQLIEYSIDGGVNYQPGNKFVGLATGTYEIWVQDENGCTTTDITTIQDLEGPTIISADQIEASCFGGDGSITITASGGTPPYLYSLNNGTTQSSNIFTGLNIGSYDIQIEDATGCITTDFIILNEQPSPNIDDVQKVNPNCGQSDGSIEILASGGTVPLVYSIDGGINSTSTNQFTGLTSGSYDVVVTDALGCTATQTVVLSDLSGPTIDGTVLQDPTCVGMDGIIDITASGGAPALEYSIDGGVNFQPGNQFMNLAAGTYDVVVVDANGCQANTQVTLTNQAGPTIDDVLTVEPNCGQPDGSIEILASGGTMPYEYSIDGGINSTSTNQFTGLTSGKYDVVVTDALGCMATQTVVLSDLSGPTIDGTVLQDPTCVGMDGIIEITASGGAPVLEYSIDGGVNFQPGNQFMNLAAGTYDVVVVDANGCQANTQVTLTNQAGPTIDDVLTVEPNCGQPDGSIEILASGGTMPYEYSIDGGINSTSTNQFTGLTSGSYDVVVTDALGCTATQTVVLSDLSGPTIDGTVLQDPTCVGMDGIIDITASGGAPALEYSIDGGVNFQPGNQFMNLAAGTYDVVVVDANGCQANTQVTLTNQAGPTIDDVLTVEPNCGQPDGSIEILASGGTMPYEYSIDGGINSTSTNQFTGLTSGKYDVVVTDALGCMATQTVVLSDLSGPTIDGTVLQDPTCVGMDGIIDITASGGAPALEYSIDGGVNFQPGNQFMNLAAGTYDVVVVDANGCQANTQVTLTNQAGPTIDDVLTVEPNCGQPDGSIEILASGGTTPLEYSSDGGGIYQTTNIFNSLNAGTYNVVVKDANGCLMTSNIILTDQPGPTILAVNSQDPVCLGNDGTIDITANGGTPPYQYSNDGGMTFQTSVNFTGLAAETYNLVVSDLNGCTATGVRILTDQLGPSIDNTPVVNPSCNGSDGSITVVASGGVSPLMYSEDGVTYQPSNVLTNLSQGVYIVHVQDANGCLVTSSISLSDNNGPSISNISSSDPICMESDGIITVDATGGTTPLEYSSDNGITFQVSNIFTSLPQGSYTIVVQDANSCQTSGVIVLTDIAGPTIVNHITNHPNCGQSDGSLTINGTAGTPPLEFSIDGGANFQPSNSFTGLGVGNYVLVVSDSNGCIATSNEMLTDTPGTTIDSITVIDATCNDSNGVINVNASNVTGATIEYSIDNGVSFQSSSTFTGLAPGSYNIVIIDTNNCQDAGVVSIINFSPPNIFFLGTTNPSCGLPNGQINILHNGGTPPLEFSNNGGVVYQPSDQFTGLAPGSFDLIVRDANGCMATASASLVNQPEAVVDSITVSDSYCGQNAGELTINITGGSSPIVFSIDNGTSYQPSNIFTGLTDGNYQIVVLDGNSCTTSSTASIADLLGPSIVSITPTQSSCGNPTGSIEVQGTGGVGVLEYSIDNGVIFQTGTLFTGLVSATYQVVVQDANGCQMTQSFDLIDIDAPIITQVNETETTCGQTDGSLVIAATGVNVPLLYSIDNGANLQGSNLFNSLAAGVYDILVQDTQGCTTTQQFTLNDNPGATITNLVASSSVCGQANGSITVLTNGGAIPLQYSIDGTTYKNTNLFDNLVASNYTFSVKDNNGCITTSSTTLNDILAPSITNVLTTDPACGQNNGDMTINVTNGTSPFEYSIDNGVNFQSSNTFNGLMASNYQIIVQDANSCSTSSIVTLVNLDGPLVSSVTPTNPDCDATNGTIEIAITNGTAPYDYVWNTTPVQTTATATGLGTGTYMVTVTDANNCSTTTMGLIEMSVGPMVDLGADSTSCDDPMALLDAGNPSAAFVWSTGETTQSIVAEDFGSYFVTVTAPNSCTAIDSISFIPTNFNPQIMADTFIKRGESIELMASGGDSYLWSPADSLSCSKCPNPVVTPTTSTVYTVEITTSDGCSETREVIVQVVKKIIELVEIPDGFSPNGDGTNDEFYIPYLEEFPFNRLTVINRWGDVVFDANPYLNDWTGTYKGQPLPQGTYYYILETDVNINYALKGPITILK